MSEKKFDGAFPYGFIDVSQYQHFQAGLSIRQYYKAAALTGLTAALKGMPSVEVLDDFLSGLAATSAAIADRMIEEDEEHSK